MNSEIIDIVMVTYLRTPITLKSLKYINERTSSPYRLTLVVNGVWEHNKDDISKYKELHEKNIIDHLILIGENYGIHAAKNVALPLVHSSPFYIDMDNDILVPDLPGEKDWVAQLIDLMKDRPEYGSISLRPQILIGRSPSEFKVKGEVVEFSHIGAHGRIMSVESVKNAGGWEKTWDALRNHEDGYIASKLKDSKLKSGYAKNLRCWHQFGDENTDPWGYPAQNKPEDHGHREIWPPVNRYTKLADFDPKTWEPAKK